MEKTPQRGKTQKTNGRKILQNTPEKTTVVCDTTSDEKLEDSGNIRFYMFDLLSMSIMAN